MTITERYRAVIEFHYQGQLIAPGEEVEIEIDERPGEPIERPMEIERMIQRGGVTRVTREIKPTEREPAPPAPPSQTPPMSTESAEAVTKRPPGTRPSGYGRRDMKPTE